MGTLISVLGNSSRAFFQAVLGQPTLKLVPGGRLVRLSSLLSLLSRSDEAAESLLAEKFLEMSVDAELSEYEARALTRIRDLMQLRSLAFGKTAQGKMRLRQGFVSRTTTQATLIETQALMGNVFTVQDITESATAVADLYWKLLDTCLGSIPELKPLGLSLYWSLFGVSFQAEEAKQRLLVLTDRMQSDLGISFLLLNLIRQGAVEQAREIGRHLMTEGVELQDEERATALYWFAELFWFRRAWAMEKLSHETSLRYLYHLCFTTPDRAGFLEIDSQFFQEFEAVNDLAQEAFTYRETLVESLLELWRDYEGDFDPFFQSVLESVVGQTSKIYDQRQSWETLWKRNEGVFSRDYLYVVEGNLCYGAGLYPEAAECYESALELNPTLRPALLNLLFVYARLNRIKDQLNLADRLLKEGRFLPQALSVIGNSFLLANDEETSEEFYHQLQKVPGWEKKVDYYKSTFCFENSLFAKAVRFAKRAVELNPSDVAMAYHLSLCYNALGEKENALEVLGTLGSASKAAWLDFYRFKLERDLGNDSAASSILREIPSDYFEDEAELEDALSFARSRQDLVLLRHLKTKKVST